MNLECIDNVINQEMQEGKLTGASIAVWKNDQLVHKAAYGNNSLNSIYKIFSMSKLITSAAAMAAHERYGLDFNAPVRQYLPAFAKMKIFTSSGETTDAQTEMTIQHLMNMSAGFSYPGTDCAGALALAKLEAKISRRIADGEKLTTAEICNEMGHIPLMFEPGTRWKYCISADIIGGIIEKISGMSYGTFLKKELFEPLGMVDTGFYVLPEKAHRIAAMAQREESSMKVHLLSEEELVKETDPYPLTLPSRFINRTEQPVFESGGAGLYSTLDDYGRFLSMLYHKGVFEGRRVLSKESVAYISQNKLSQEAQKTIKTEAVAGFCLQGYTYSNFVRIMLNPKEATGYGCIGNPGEYGWDGLPGNYCLIDPAAKLFLVYFEQNNQGVADLDFRNALRKAVYSL